MSSDSEAVDEMAEMEDPQTSVDILVHTNGTEPERAEALSRMFLEGLGSVSIRSVQGMFNRCNKADCRVEAFVSELMTCVKGLLRPEAMCIFGYLEGLEEQADSETPRSRKRKQRSKGAPTSREVKASKRQEALDRKAATPAPVISWAKR